MKPSTKFLFFLCIWLQGDPAAVFASSQSSNLVHSLCSQLQQANLPLTSLDNQQPFVRPPANLPRENDLVVFKEEDNEDEHTRKLKSPTEPVSLFFCTYIAAYPCLVPGKSFLLYRNNNYPGNGKYLACRVLRI